MKLVEWFRPPRVVMTLFIGLMALCALALGWLGWQVLVQDRAVEAQRQRDQLESAADRAVAVMERAFTAADAEVAVVMNADVEIAPAGRIAYVPAQNAAQPAQTEIFAEAEAMEFGKQDRVKAANAYQRLAESGSAPVRAGALMRLGRLLRREGKWAEALQAYASLEKFDATLVAGMPAVLVARAARCSVLAESGDGPGARLAAAALWAELTAGKWKITKATLETYLNELKVLAPDLVLPADWDERVTLAAAAQWAFQQQPASGRAALCIAGRAVSVSWERQGSAWKARLTGPSTWNALWTNLEHDTGTVLRVADAEGHVLHGAGLAHSQTAFRAAEMTGLPWSVTAADIGNAEPSKSWTARRRLLIGGLLVFALLVGSGSFLIVRAIGREFAVARLQSDFVAAVSHEFRTPLTSMRQLTEMLARGRMESEQHKQRAYELMLGESDRLRRLVESILDFGRMQGREYKFRSDDLEAAQWTRSVAEEFQETVRNRGYAIEFTGPAEAARLRGDREALSGALWNLLDNAVKYSPDEKQVQMAVSCSNGRVEVSVRDRGSGIAKEDLKRVFSKFYRGANAKKQGTKGTGIGLAMVKEIVEAHGGTVRVRSELGQGSEFTMVLPCRES
jgi:signal transduction histidine kinase